ncbi:GNAT family N-acetyltransferase [Streptacidiphilus sp. PB12-B1b]|uniref:GNAT family N-acetyltransferase n=1 Tax=Streptacidiphilus sp. PB12-B1b TaxID=2705012 RepID=UPI001CDC15EF|nr:GNAT family N-acetyltransferase [Streptacidiphilus sp. PB12-B1b]
MIPCSVIPTERLRLQPASAGAARLLARGGDGGWTWLGGAPGTGTRDLAGIVERADEVGWHRPPWGLFVIVRDADGLAVGGSGFHGPPDAEGSVEVGYELVAQARGLGYATETLRALTAFAFTHPAVRAVTAGTYPENTASQQVLLRAGFGREGDLGGLHRYRVDR